MLEGCAGYDREGGGGRRSVEVERMGEGEGAAPGLFASARKQLLLRRGK